MSTSLPPETPAVETDNGEDKLFNRLLAMHEEALAMRADVRADPSLASLAKAAGDQASRTRVMLREYVRSLAAR